MLKSPEALDLPKKLRDTLSAMMTAVTFKEELVVKGCLPLLLVLRTHAVTAFATGDEDDYELLYEAFKKYYLKQAFDWSAKDISFVYCIPPGISVNDSFRSRVEVDVYFCRKYAILLQNDLAACLSRLPFLPLSPIASGLQARPPSAQTLLQRSNLKAELASALVMPAKSSASTILTSCLSGTFGDPAQIAEIPNDSFSKTQTKHRAQTTLKSLSIENFRAYRQKKEFTLGSAVTVLYGPNGFGKTSFFDAIDFAITGGVGRLAKVSGGLAKAAKHLDSGDEPTIVSVTLERDGQQHVITRNLAEHNNALVDGSSASRKDVLSLLTGGVSVGADRVDNMVALFRATHLFSQENQELTKYVDEKCELPADIVSRMLAFEDYVSGLNKAEDVLKLARKMLKDAQEQAQDSRKSIDHEREELRRLEGIAAEKTSPAELKERFLELQHAISAAGFSTTGIDSRDTRSLRAMLESSAAHAVAERASISKAIEHAGCLKTLRVQLEPIAAQLVECKTQLDHALKSADEAAKNLAMHVSALTDAKTQEKATQNKREKFIWATSVLPEYERISTQAPVLRDGLSAHIQRLEHQNEAQSKALEVHQESVSKVQRLETALITVRESRSRLDRLKELALLWEDAEPKLMILRELEIKLLSEIKTRQAQLDKAQQGVLAQELLVARLEAELAAAKSNDTALKGLIAELRTHIQGGTCLLCGHDHGNQDRLLDAVGQRMEKGDVIVRLSEKIASGREKLQAQLAARNLESDELSQEAQRLEQIKIEREQLERQRADYETALSAVGVALSSNTIQRFDQMNVQMHETEKDAKSEVYDAQNQLTTATAALASATDKYKKLERERQTLSVALDAVTRRMDELAAEANHRALNLADGLNAFIEAQRYAEIHLVQASAAVRTTDAALETHKAFSATTRANLSTARTLHQQVSHTFNSYQSNIQASVVALTASGFDGDTTEEHLNQQISLTTTQEVTALGLRDQAAKLEVAVDTAATSAAFQNLRKRIHSNETQLGLANDQIQKVKPWIAYFEGITKLLSGEQAIATKHFITQYGPRTAVIQQRLRPVYGFGEIEVSSRDSTISILVNRKGEALRPTDYFSQSQIQTLVLGLFLTACSSQTWSGFSSIMMDDPVTHFDDLNMYALLDLILGLRSSTEGARQFIISTCDEKLLQLARQKFKHMGDEAKFYSFSAIGVSGPMVSEIAN